MNQCADFQISNVFPKIGLVAYHWLSGSIPAGDANSMRAIMSNLCDKAPVVGGKQRITDLPGVYAWVVSTSDHRNNGRRVIHIGRSVASMRRRNCCHIKNAYVGVDAVWELERKGFVRHCKGLGVLDASNRPRTAESQQVVAKELAAVQILFIAVLPNESGEGIESQVRDRIADLEGALIHAARRRLSEWYEINRDSVLSNTHGKTTEPDHGVQEAAWKEFERVLAGL